MSALIASVYVLGVLTIISVIVLVFLLFKFFGGKPLPPKSGDELQQLNIGEVLKYARELLDALNKARPVAIAALITILFLLGWLFALSLLVAAQTPH